MERKTASGTMLTLLLVTMLCAVFNAPVAADWTGTVTIKPDGSVDPPTAPILRNGDLYTLTDNVTILADAHGIIIDRNNMTLDGAGYTIQGTGRASGIKLEFGRSNITIKNTKIKSFNYGFYPFATSNNSIVDNNITNNEYGIYLWGASNYSISGNHITNNTYGIYLIGTSNNSIFGNTFVNDGLALWDSYNNTVQGNVVNGKPMVYLEDVSNFAVGDAGQVIAVTSDNIRVENLNLSNATVGVELWGTHNSTIANNNITANSVYGIWIEGSVNSTIVGNNITNNNAGIYGGGKIFRNNITNNGYGIRGGGTIFENNITNNYVGILGGGNIFRNNITNNSGFGIGLADGVVSTNKLTNNGHGVSIYGSNSTILGNNITNNNGYGILVTTVAVPAKYNNISGNHVTANQYGISLGPSYMNILRNNTMADNKYNFDASFYYPDNSFQDVDTSNTVDGKPIYYWINKQNLTIPLDAGYVGLVNSTDITVQNLTLTKNGQGILLVYTTHSTLANNTITNNFQGISLKTSSNNTISRNDLTANSRGIEFWNSQNNNITENNIKNNEYGIRLDVSSNNSIYHNSFIINTNQVYVSSGYANVWDDGYPSGGNYWSDYTGVDEMRGPNQDQPGSDGIGDTPYVIDTNNRDRYPLMKPYAGLDDIGISVKTFKTGCLPIPIVGQGLSLSIKIMVFNYGNDTETFNVTVYINKIIMSTFTSITLTSRNSATITLTWNTTGFAKGNYTISATATAVPGETDTKDNTYVDWVIVAMLGDITGPTMGVPDGKVDVRDLSYMAIRYGTLPGYTPPGKLPYNTNADINGDGKIDIKDLATGAKQYGKIDP